jgi:hypothetical protein
MSIFKRGRTYWFHLYFSGRQIQRSTKQSNRNAACGIESAYRTKLANGEVGIHEPKQIPVFSDAMKNFLAWSEVEHAAHLRTQAIQNQFRGLASSRASDSIPSRQTTQNDSRLNVQPQRISARNARFGLRLRIANSLARRQYSILQSRAACHFRTHSRKSSF